MYKIPLKKCNLRNNKPTKEPKYLNWLHEVLQPSCFVCGNTNKIELHHVKEYSSDIKDDRSVIPLCGEEHHRNGKLSPHGAPKQWREIFPIDIQREYAKELYDKYLDII